ncbi:MAG TPA: lysozyme [Rugosimonospora sp.]|nr:lysozyme [Rugosimonospora sp.]
MTIALLAAKLIQSFEGVKLRSYFDKTGKVWTVGWGHTGFDVEPGMEITLEEATGYWMDDSAPLIALVEDRPLIEAAALVSFGYNCGIGALKRVLSGEIEVTHEEFTVRDSRAPYGELSGGVKLAGLYARRQLEAALIEASREMLSQEPIREMLRGGKGPT